MLRLIEHLPNSMCAVAWKRDDGATALATTTTPDTRRKKKTRVAVIAGLDEKKGKKRCVNE